MAPFGEDQAHHRKDVPGSCAVPLERGPQGRDVRKPRHEGELTRYGAFTSSTSSTQRSKSSSSNWGPGVKERPMASVKGAAIF